MSAELVLITVKETVRAIKVLLLVDKSLRCDKFKRSIICDPWPMRITQFIGFVGTQ